MKLVIVLMFLTSCASTSVVDKSGKTRFKTQADSDYVIYKSPEGDTLIMTKSLHSTTTTAVGTAASSITGGVVSGVVGAVTAIHH